MNKVAIMGDNRTQHTIIVFQEYNNISGQFIRPYTTHSIMYPERHASSSDVFKSLQNVKSRPQEILFSMLMMLNRLLSHLAIRIPGCFVLRSFLLHT